MALESASYINQLLAANPLSTDPVSQSDDHLRLIKAVLLATFPNLDGPVTVKPSQLNYPVPQGAIIMWSGSTGTVPLGYQICDGTNGTPDLRDKFVIGAGNTYAVNTTGGSDTSGFGGAHTHTANNATASLTLTTHAAPTGAGANVVDGVTATGHAHTINSVGDHTHPALPPYLALCFIMKM